MWVGTPAKSNENPGSAGILPALAGILPGSRVQRAAAGVERSDTPGLSRCQHVEPGGFKER